MSQMQKSLPAGSVIRIQVLPRSLQGLSLTGRAPSAVSLEASTRMSSRDRFRELTQAAVGEVVDLDPLRFTLG